MLIAVVLGVLALVGLLLVCLFLYVTFTRKALNKHPLVRFIPGYPIVGNLFDFLDKNQVATCLNYRAKYGPFVECYLFTDKAFMVSDSTICKEILTKRPKKFRRTALLNYPNEKLKISSGLFGAEGTVWSHIRKATAPSFSNLNITHKFPVILTEIVLWLQRLQQLSQTCPATPIDMKKETSYLTIRIITIVAFGLDPSDALLSYFFDEFTTDVTHIFTFLEKSTGFPLPMDYWKYSPDYPCEGQALAAAQRFAAACQRIIDFKRQLAKDGKLPMNCMLDSMLAHAASDATTTTTYSEKLLTDEEIIANVQIFYIAGSDTTSLSITWLMYYFSLHPTLLSQLRAEASSQLFPGGTAGVASIRQFLSKLQSQEVSFSVDQFKALTLTQATIKEVLRMNSPAIIIFLEVNDESVTLSNGIELDPHQFVLINTDGLHYDAQVFPNPHSFTPQRWLNTGNDEKALQAMESSWFPFGYGPRMCPGMNLALVEIAIAVSMIALFIERVDLLCPKEEIKRVPNFIVGVNQMPVALRFFKNDE